MPLLLHALRLQKFETAKYLLQIGADPNNGAMDRAGCHLMWQAAAHFQDHRKRERLMILLVKSSISVNSPIQSICSKLRERAERENEALPLTLAAFFEAFETYKNGHPDEFSQDFTDQEQEQMQIGEKNLDRALGYAP